MIRKLIICIAVLVGFCPMAWGTVDDVPNPKTYDADNWVSDPDHILDSETKNKINDILQQLEDSLTIEVAVVALHSIGEEEPHEFAVTLFNRWGVGKAEDDNGLLILLTRDGRQKAEAIYERHCILCRFLEDVLGISADTAAADACRIEHIISEETFDHIKSFLNEQYTDGGQR